MKVALKILAFITGFTLMAATIKKIRSKKALKSSSSHRQTVKDTIPGNASDYSPTAS